MKFPMMVAGLGTVLNIVLDPIFIFDLENYGGIGFGLGVAGAAMATVISQAIVFCVFIYMLFVKEHSYITFRLKDFSFSTDIILKPFLLLKSDTFIARISNDSVLLFLVTIYEFLFL